MKIRIITSIVILQWIYITAEAQILEHPLNYNPEISQEKLIPVSVRTSKAVSLPFADDFSQGTSYPESQYWEDNQAFINTTLALNPPSMGVATLDGLDAEGIF